MADVTSQDRAALEAARAAQEAARRAAEAARKAAEEQARLQAAQAQRAGGPAAPADANAPISKDTFSAEARVPGVADPAELDSLFAQYDTDGEAGLSGAELTALYQGQAAKAAPEARGAVSDGVQGDVDAALKDDTDTAEDLRDAATHVQTAEDVHLIMAAAEAKGLDPNAVLQGLLKGQDEGADEPNTAVFEAIAQHHERLGEPEAAAATRAAGNPDISRGVRHDIIQALHDGTDTAEDLRDAAKNARTPADLAAILQANAATGASDVHPLLQEALKGLDEEAEVPNSGLLEAIAGEFEKLGMADHAEAARRAADPTIGSDVRKELIHALQDDTDTAEDIADALEKSDTDAETDASTATGDATIGEAHTAQLAAVAEVKDAQEAYDDALKAVEEHNQTLQQAMGQMQGMPPEEQEAFVAEFKARHPEYAEVDAAKSNLAETVAANQDAIAAVLESGAPLAEVDAGALEKALQVAAEDPAGLAAATAITTRIMQNARNVPEDRLAMITEKVLPGIFAAQMEKALASHAGDPQAAMDEVEGSPLFEALETIDAVGGIKGDVDAFVTGYKELATAIRAGDADAAADAVNQAMDGENVSKLGVGLAGVGLVLGAVAFTDASGFAAKTQAALETASSGSEVIAAAGKTFGRLGGLPAVLERAGPVLGIVAGAISGFQNLKEGDYVGAAVDGATVALSVLAMTTAIPGLGVAAGVLAGGLFIYQAWQGHQAQERRTDEIKDIMADIGIEKGLADFLTNSDAGSYERCREELGLSDAQIRDLVKDGSPWTRQLDDFATEAFKARLLPTLAPDGDLAGALDRLAEGLGPDGVAHLALMLNNLSHPSLDVYTGEPKSLRDQLVELQMTFPAPMDAEGAQQQSLAMERLRTALGI